ncbi:MAG TPA: DUF6596 domain-containing protein [Candidatus Kapabacteria bacterium]|nr:DUF6596 domain-containing protein [Candidatus Kapabacteria bacterium]
MPTEELIPHLFRTEYRKIVSALCKRFGFAEIEIAEDIASDTFLTAAQTWALSGIPPNPAAWLYTVAKNKAKNHFERQRIFDASVAPELQKRINESYEVDLSEQNMIDSQLQMMFALSHPSIPPEAQIGLSLRILCGFGIEEIADAFLTNKETINKRLFRAKAKLRDEHIAIELPSQSEMQTRMESVLRTIYLLFNEGYYSVSGNTPLREDLCMEAMRLAMMLIEYPETNKPQANALMSLMCFQASRFSARVNSNGEIVLYEDQDESLWDTDLIARGVYFMHRAAQGNRVSKYHLEACIAYWSTQKTDSIDKWENILQFYNQLLQIKYSPIAALNRTYALSKARSVKEAISEAEKLDLNDNHFYFTLLGELYTGIDTMKAKQYFQTAYSLAKSATDKQTIRKKMDKV